MALLPLLLVSAPAWAGDCAEPVSAGELTSLLAAGRAAWVAMDRAAFDLATEARRSALPCMVEPIAPPLALEYHLGEALAWSLERRSDLEHDEIRAMLVIDPAWELPLDLAPEHHRLREDFDAVRAGSPAADLRWVPAPAGCVLNVDGSSTNVVPSDLPFVAQALDADGRVLRTAYLAPVGGQVAAIEAWMTGVAPEPAPLPEAPASPSRSGAALLAGGVGLGLFAGGLYAAAAVQSGALERGEVPCDALTAAGNRVNGLVLASGGTGLVAVGLLTAGIAVRF